MTSQILNYKVVTHDLKTGVIDTEMKFLTEESAEKYVEKLKATEIDFSINWGECEIDKPKHFCDVMVDGMCIKYRPKDFDFKKDLLLNWCSGCKKFSCLIHTRENMCFCRTKYTCIECNKKIELLLKVCDTHHMELCPKCIKDNCKTCTLRSYTSKKI
jgi:hypothetical protein